MMKKTLLIGSIVLLLVLPIAYASVSSVTTSASTNRATTGTSVTATVTVTATSSESGSIQLVCTPSGTTISDPSSGQYQGVSLSTTPTSKTFTLTAGTANTYTCSGQSGGTSSDSPVTIVFVDPSALTVTGTPSSTTTATGGGSFTLTANIRNSQSSAITTSYSLSLSGYSTTGDATSGTITVAASSTTSLTWTVTTSSSSGTITFSLGSNSNAFSSVVTVPSAPSEDTTTTITTSSSLPTTPGVTVTPVKGKVTIVMPSITAGSSAVANIDVTEDVAFTQIVVYAKATITRMQIIATKLDSKPTGVSDVSGTVYHYINVEKNITDASINKTTIRFRVERSWVNTNNIDNNTIALYRYSDNQWNKLTTTYSSADSENIVYDAESSGLSYFAIAGEAKVTPEEEAPPAEAPPAEAPEEKILGIIPTKGKGLIITIVIVLVVVIGGVVFYLIKKNIIKLDEILPKKKSGWDELKKKYRR